LREIPPIVRRKIKFIPVQHMEQVLENSIVD